MGGRATAPFFAHSQPRSGIGRPAVIRVRRRRPMASAPAIKIENHYHVHEAVLRCMQQHLADLSPDGKIRKGYVHGRIIVPLLARGGLIVPQILPGPRIERDDGTEEQIVPALGAAHRLHIGIAVAGTDIDAAC